MTVEFKLEGLDKALATMRGLPVQLRKKAARGALRKAAIVVRNAARANASRLDDPATANNIAKNIDMAFSSREYRLTGDLRFRVGVRGGARKFSNTRQNVRKGRAGKEYVTGGSTFYWRFLEFGTQKMAARPFMRPALEANLGRATDAFINELNKQLDRIIRKGR